MFSILGKLSKGLTGTPHNTSLQKGQKKDIKISKGSQTIAQHQALRIPRMFTTCCVWCFALFFEKQKIERIKYLKICLVWKTIRLKFDRKYLHWQRDTQWLIIYMWGKNMCREEKKCAIDGAKWFVENSCYTSNLITIKIH